MKTCIHCGETKEFACFTQNSARRDGLSSVCRVCKNSEARRAEAKPQRKTKKRAYEATRREDHRRDCREHRRRYPQRKYEQVVEWRRQNPQKVFAHRKVNNSIRDGKFVRKPCRLCGEKAHAHHEDYSKPLNVEWLCPLHHKAIHRGDAVSAIEK